MGTHPIFESDFDCLTECGDSFAVWDSLRFAWDELTNLYQKIAIKILL